MVDFNKAEPPILSLQRARELSGNTEMSDEELQNVLHNVQQFCEMVYDIYLLKQQQDKEAEIVKLENSPDADKNNIRLLYPEAETEYLKAA